MRLVSIFAHTNQAATKAGQMAADLCTYVAKTDY
jgi:hypothetical protein